MIITSTQNARIKDAVRLQTQQRERDKRGRTVIEGYRQLLRAVDNGYPLATLFICPALFLGENERALIARAKSAGAEVVEVAEEPFRKMAYYDRPEGLLAVAEAVRRKISDAEPGERAFFLAAESIQRPGNLGAIFRSADAAGVDGVIVCDAQTDPFNPEVIRASVGTLFTVPFYESSSAEAAAWCRQHGIRIAAATPHTETAYTGADMTRAVAVAVGAEQFGLSETWLANADVRVRIPMHGQADSLNVATAATLLLYEVVRQRAR